MKKNREKNHITAWSTYHLNTLLCKIWYKSEDKYGTDKRFGTHTPVNMLLFHAMSKIGQKIEENMHKNMNKFICSIWYHHSTYKYGAYKHLGAHTPIHADFQCSKFG